MTTIFLQVGERTAAQNQVRRLLFLWLCVAFLPVILAVTTWPGVAPDLQDKLRHLSIPVVAVELAVVIAAMKEGLEFQSWFAGSPLWVQCALALLVSIAFGTAIFVAVDRNEALIRTSTSLVHLLFAISSVYLLRSVWLPFRYLVWPSIVLGILGYCTVVAVMVATVAREADFDWLVFSLGVTNIRQTGFISLVGSCAALGLAVNSNSFRNYMFWVACGAITLGLSFWGGTRGAVAAYIVTAGIAAFATIPARRARILATSMLTTAIAIPLSMLHDAGQPFMGFLRMIEASSGGGDVSTGRWETWKLTAAMILERPLWGAGESQFRLLFEPWHGAYNHPHNWFLQIFFQWGIIGGICYFSLAGCTATRFFNKCSVLGAPALPAYLVAVSIVTLSLCDGAMYYPYPIAMLSVALAWIFAAEGENLENVAQDRALNEPVRADQ